MTVAEKIRQCSDEELADFLYSIYLTGKTEQELNNIITSYKSYKDIYDWMLEEVN